MNLIRLLDVPPLPPRPVDGHKGTFGRVLIVGGSRGMSGAACLSGLAALRGGAGLVFVAVPASVQPIVAATEPSYLTIALPEDAAGRLSVAAREPLADRLAEFDAIAVGPGWGRSDELTELAAWLFVAAPCPLVVDADALNALAARPDVFDARRNSATDPPSRILTPHPGEFARLTGRAIAEIQADREHVAAEFAATHGTIVVLKGPGTVIADGTQVAINTTGNSGLATGGTGDVLTGLIAALLAQKLEPFAAARLGAHLHGLAGDLAARDLSEPALIASDLPRYLGAAWKQLG